MTHTVKVFSVDHEVDILLEPPCFLYDPMNVNNLISGSSAFSKRILCIWKFSFHILLKPNFKDFEHNLISMWNEYSCLVQFYSVTQSCPTLCDPMDCSTPGFPVHHQFPDSWPLSQWFHPTISSSVVPFSSHLQSYPESGSFVISQFFASGGQSIGASASASVLMNIQDWFPLRCTGLISLQSRGLSRVFSNTTVQKHQLFGALLSL